MKKVFVFSFFVLCFLFFDSSVKAQGSCQGGSITCNGFSVDCSKYTNAGDCSTFSSNNCGNGPGCSWVNDSGGGGSAVNGNNVGPELPDPSAAVNVVQKNGFSGTVAVINNLRDPNSPDSPHNPAPFANAILRVDVDEATFYASQNAINYANELNASSSFKPGTLIVFGIELNNLDSQGWNSGVTGGAIPDRLVRAATDYAQLFNIFSSTIDHTKYKVAPAPPDLYNANYDATLWLQTFNAHVQCNLVDTLVAEVFDTQPAPKVAQAGYSNLDTWKYLQANLCGGAKQVSHFEGWGAWPGDTIANQVKFLKSTALPGGSVQTATTLIVNNCNGFGGNQNGTPNPNSPWLYWVPTTPDKVYNADGSEFDYSSCAGSTTTPPQTYDVSNEVPCDATSVPPLRDPEYHSLRPYPASPCYKKVDETALTCGNDLIVKKTFHVTPNGNCTAPDANGNFTCNYTETGIKDTVAIDLTSAQIPIVGDTTDVPNGTWTSANTSSTNLTAAQRVNGYVSWYLNGVINRAEEDFSSNDPNYLVNFSGPLNKLLPFAIQQVVRIANITASDQTVNHSISDPKAAIHDQTVGCILPPNIFGVLKNIPCYLFNKDYLVSLFKNSLDPNISQIINSIINDFAVVKSQNRIYDFKDNKPPLETDSSTLSDWLQKYSQWLGNLCISSIFGCSTSSNSIWGAFFNHIPLSSTEDRVGQVFTDKTVPDPSNSGQTMLEKTPQLPDGGGNGATVTNVSFAPDAPSSDTVASHNLYFGHMQEDASLAKLLQGTYAAYSDPNDPNGWENTLQKAIVNQNEAPTFPTNGCVPQEVRSGNGDSLYGNIDRQTANGNTDQKITGTLTYNATFSCQFKTTTNQQCVSQCQGDPACINACTTTSNTCDKDVYTSLGIFTRTPKAYELSQRLVDGSMGVFKRFFPKVGVDAPVTQIKDIPAATTVNYSSDGNGTQAGKTGQSGSNAQLYFDHIGSLQDYFLEDIQKALRPKDFNTETQPGPGANCKPANPTNVTNENVNGANYTISDGVIGLALQVSKYTCTPAELLIGVLAKETHGTTYDVSADGKSLLTTQTPLTGDPTEKSYHQYWSLDYWDPLNPNSPLRPDPTHDLPAYFFGSGAYQYSQNDIADQIKSYGSAIQPCLDALSTGTDNDTRKVGVAMCVAGAQMWRGTILARTRTCDGAKMLSDLSDQEIANAIITFHGADDGTLNSYLAEVHAFQAAVTTVRGQMAACLNTK